MARIRTLKPELWAHEKIGRLKRDERLLFVVLITQADDDGRLRDLPRALLGDGYPHDRITERQIEKWLAALERERLITRYGCGRERFIAIRGWTKHQRIDKYRASTLPAPDGFSAQGQGLLDVDSTNVRGGLPPGSRIKDQEEDQEPEDPPSPPQAGGAEWASIRASLEEGLGDSAFHFYIAPLEPVSLVGDRLTLRAPDHVRTWVRDSFMRPIQQAADESVSPRVIVELEEPQAERRPRRGRRAA